MLSISVQDITVGTVRSRQGSVGRNYPTTELEAASPSLVIVESLLVTHPNKHLLGNYYVKTRL